MVPMWLCSPTLKPASQPVSRPYKIGTAKVWWRGVLLSAAETSDSFRKYPQNWRWGQSIFKQKAHPVQRELFLSPLGY